MSGFDRRREGFEGKFALDEELKFKAIARRDKMLGLWAAEKMDLTGAAAEEYAREVARADQQEPGDEDVVRKLTRDFATRGLPITDAQIRHEMARLLPVAVQQVTKPT
jgi:hypothetical protein